MPNLLLSLYLAILAFEYTLGWLNLKHQSRHGGDVPAGFEGAMDEERLQRAVAYARAHSRLGLVESLVGNLLVLLFLFAGGLSWYDGRIDHLTDDFVFGGMAFFSGLILAQGVLSIPFGLYRTFVLEERHGFNTTTLRLWMADLIKSVLVSVPLLGLLLGGALWLVEASPQGWWFWIWLFFALFCFLRIVLAPRFIEPLFHRIEPVRDEDLLEQIAELMDRAGLCVGQVLQMDASRRSRHSNAYFTGIGRVKRIVLFDTLLEQLERSEILAVLAHEVGHWKRNHVLTRLIRAGALSLAGLLLAHRLLAWEGLPGLLGLEDGSFPARVLIVLFLFSLAGFFLRPLSNALSRRQERQADRYAVQLFGDARSLASALVKLSRENLANLHPHPLYACLHYSHPPMVERVRSLQQASRDSSCPAG